VDLRVSVRARGRRFFVVARVRSPGLQYAASGEFRKLALITVIKGEQRITANDIF